MGLTKGKQHNNPNFNITVLEDEIESLLHKMQEPFYKSSVM